jgi:hypothetical protein
MEAVLPQGKLANRRYWVGILVVFFNGNHNGSSCNDHDDAADASGVLSGPQFFRGPSKTTEND